MLDAIFALILSVHGHTAMLDRAGPFATVEACRAFVRVQKTTTACITASQLDGATRLIFNLPADEIWK